MAWQRRIAVSLVGLWTILLVAWLNSYMTEFTLKIFSLEEETATPPPDWLEEDEDEDWIPADSARATGDPNLMDNPTLTGSNLDIVTPSTVPEIYGKPVNHGKPEPETRADAFCRCSQLGGNTPPEGLESFAKEELKNLLKEMRKKLRIYIYPTDPYCNQRRPKLTNRGYMVEWNFYDRAILSSMRVKSPENASIYYIPTFTSCWRNQGKTRHQGGEAVGKRMKQVMEKVSESPFWQRYAGKKHIWVSAHDMGKGEPFYRWCVGRPEDSEKCQMLATNSTVLTNTADDLETASPRIEKRFAFNRFLDVSLVCNGDTSVARASFSVKPTHVRKFSVFFAGKWDKNYVKVRYQAIRSIQEEKLPKPTNFPRQMSLQAYQQSLADTELCLAPRGSRVWSPRLFEMIWFGCIPVIIASGYHLPASCFFDWKDFSILIEDKDAGKAGQILKKLLSNRKRLELMRQKVFEIRKTFMWNKEEISGDAFELAMLDVYLKQQRRC